MINNGTGRNFIPPTPTALKERGRERERERERKRFVGIELILNLLKIKLIKLNLLKNVHENSAWRKRSILTPNGFSIYIPIDIPIAANYCRTMLSYASSVDNLYAQEKNIAEKIMT